MFLRPIRVRWRRRYSMIALCLFAVGACVPNYVSAYTVSGPSDAPTLLLGDRVIVNRAAFDLKLPYSTSRLGRVGEPKRGDLVLFLVPNRNRLGLKRVVGIAGDRLEMRANRLLVNGREATYVSLSRADFDRVPPEHEMGTVVKLERGEGEQGHRITFTPDLSPLGSFGLVVVPEECVFLLGDHRDNSNDSRTFGPIGLDLLGGKVVKVLAGGLP